ncbi:hypothetical protein ACPV5O_02630 [Vibrio maritimus]|uniref:Uncharacterized protein n=2 Tax=Vibrio TaxID=662 RepID=A0A090RSI2_9VIBR|nr:hypothetical protein [Vibrio maritimus]GAL17184.1 hypothetical protein JCM19235_5733 [Vibrio maritimus]GAL30902.1 hypothetical protein JCM19239_4730 [Vibrio variabilis]
MKALIIAALTFGFAVSASAQQLEPAGVATGQGGSNVCLYKAAGTDTVVYALNTNTPCPTLTSN